jgi:asparagine synthase (glutamine-hydrolysing)
MVILVVYGGSDEDLKFWHARARLHSTWLGLEFESSELIIQDRNKLLIANVYKDNVLNLASRPDTLSLNQSLILRKQQAIWSLECISDQEYCKLSKSALDENDTWIAYDSKQLSLSVWCGLLALGQIFYRREKDSWIISNDLRLLLSQDSEDLDPAGWYSLFQFGAIPAPLTPFKTLRRVPAGHLSRLSVREFIVQHAFRPFARCNDALTPSGGPDELMENVLNAEIDKIPPLSGLFFSGGIDSGLLAALAKRRQRSDLLLINCDFSGSSDAAFTDPEAQHARKMSEYLNCRFESLRFDNALVPDMLGRVGKDYSFVFADYSTIASNLLAHFAADLFRNGSWMVDGTGADGIFLGTSTWKWLSRLYQIPVSIRKAVASLFRLEPIFMDGRRASRYLGTISQSLHIPPLQAHVILESRLAGIAFKADSQSINEVLLAYKNYLEVFFDDLDERAQFSLLDLVHICIGRFAAKVYDPLRSRGLNPFFPFLTQDVVRTACHIMNDVQGLNQNKRVLRSLLRRDVPSEMIYRPKSGFTPPIEAIFNEHTVKSYIIDVVLSPHNPIREFVQPQKVERMFHRIWSGRPIFEEHFNFLWAYVFGSLWFDQQLKYETRPARQQIFAV